MSWHEVACWINQAWQSLMLIDISGVAPPDLSSAPKDRSFTNVGASVAANISAGVEKTKAAAVNVATAAKAALTQPAYNVLVTIHAPKLGMEW